MKVYSSGILGFVATVGSLVANLQVNQGFNHSNNIFFWGAQAIFAALFLWAFAYSWLHWEDAASLPKWHLFRSVIVCILLYLISFTGSKYAMALIFALGITEIFLTRKRYGLIKMR